MYKKNIKIFSNTILLTVIFISMKTIQIKNKYYGKLDDNKQLVFVVSVRSNHELSEELMIDIEQFIEDQFGTDYVTDEAYKEKLEKDKQKELIAKQLQKMQNNKLKEKVKADKIKEKQSAKKSNKYDL